MRTILATALAALLLPALARADTVTMPEKVEISGRKIQILEIRDDEVLVRVAYGDIVIPRSRIVSMKVDFPARIELLKEEAGDIPRALFKLACVCKQLGMAKEAQQACLDALARGNVPADLLLPMAASLEACEDWASARACYAEYLKVHPDDAAVQAKARAAADKAAELGPQATPTGAPEIAITEIAPTGPKRVVVKPEPGVPAPVEPAPQPGPAPQPAPQPVPPEPVPPEPEQPKVPEGLEANPAWGTEAWGSTVQITVGAQKGNPDKLLQVYLAGAEQDKACVVLQDDLDLSDKKALTFDVFNLSKERIEVALAFVTRPGWRFFESMPVTVFPTGQANPHKVKLDLTDSRFKCAESKWRFKSPIENPKGIVKIILLIYTKQTDQWVFFDNINFEQADAPAAPEGPAAPGPAAPEPAAPAPVAPAPAAAN